MGKYYTTYGIGIAVALIAYFLLTKLIGLHQYPVLSALNGVIVGAGIFFAIKKYKSEAYDFKYQDGFQLGLFTGGLATILFAVFMAIYIFQVDSYFRFGIVLNFILAPFGYPF